MLLKRVLAVSIRFQYQSRLGLTSNIPKLALIGSNYQFGASPVRTYFKSKAEETPDKYSAFEKSYAEWKYVEKLFAPSHIPAPPMDPSVELPSGWKPFTPPNLEECPYLIRRTKNHQVPVYERIQDKGQIRHTVIKRVEGDIWQFEKDIGRYLKKIEPYQVIVTRTQETCRCVIIRGSYVEPVREWVLRQGF